MYGTTPLSLTGISDEKLRDLVHSTIVDKESLGGNREFVTMCLYDILEHVIQESYPKTYERLKAFDNSGGLGDFD